MLCFMINFYKGCTLLRGVPACLILNKENIYHICYHKRVRSLWYLSNRAGITGRFNWQHKNKTI